MIWLPISWISCWLFLVGRSVTVAFPILMGWLIRRHVFPDKFYSKIVFCFTVSGILTGVSGKMNAKYQVQVACYDFHSSRVHQLFWKETVLLRNSILSHFS